MHKYNKHDSHKIRHTHGKANMHTSLQKFVDALQAFTEATRDIAVAGKTMVEKSGEMKISGIKLAQTASKFDTGRNKR